MHAFDLILPARCDFLSAHAFQLCIDHRVFTSACAGSETSTRPRWLPCGDLLLSDTVLFERTSCDEFDERLRVQIEMSGGLGSERGVGNYVIIWVWPGRLLRLFRGYGWVCNETGNSPVVFRRRVWLQDVRLQRQINEIGHLTMNAWNSITSPAFPVHYEGK